jgi:hypothetical protein
MARTPANQQEAINTAPAIDEAPAPKPRAKRQKAEKLSLKSEDWLTLFAPVIQEFMQLFGPWLLEEIGKLLNGAAHSGELVDQNTGEVIDGQVLAQLQQQIAELAGFVTKTTEVADNNFARLAALEKSHEELRQGLQNVLNELSNRSNAQASIAAEANRLAQPVVHGTIPSVQQASQELQRTNAQAAIAEGVNRAAHRVGPVPEPQSSPVPQTQPTPQATVPGTGIPRGNPFAGAQQQTAPQTHRPAQGTPAGFKPAPAPSPFPIRQ